MLLTLPDDTRVRVRPIAPEDKRLLVEGLRRLSRRSAFQRFMSPKVSFSEAAFELQNAGFSCMCRFGIRCNRQRPIQSSVGLVEPPQVIIELAAHRA